MKSLASITDKDIETIKMALNDSISDINVELKGTMSTTKKDDLLRYKGKYTRVLEKLRQNPSIYALVETDLDLVATGLNDAIELLEEFMTDDLTEQEKNDFITYKTDCQRLLEVLA
jgi:hypothetical protein|tara:strand:+ start:41 stop:388 length:348 start_codon:yes stop_codon:yes gene_type:complete